VNTAVWNLKSDTSNNRGNWSHLRIIHTITEEHIWKRTTDNSRTGHSTRTSDGTNEKYTTFIMGNSVMSILNSNLGIAAILYTLETWFVSGINFKYPAKKIIIITIISAIINEFPCYYLFMLYGIYGHISFDLSLYLT
jgi:hypothetical protein